MSETDPVERTEEYKKIQPHLQEDIQFALESDGLPGNPLKRGLCHLCKGCIRNKYFVKYELSGAALHDLTPHVIFD